MHETLVGLTQRQRDILDYISHYIESNRFSPSYQEIQSHFGFSSLGSVFKHIAILKRKGALLGESHTSRSLIPAHFRDKLSQQQEIEIPFIGQVMGKEFGEKEDSGKGAIETFSRSQSITIPAFLVPTPENTYALRIEGKLFEEELIGDGDLLLIETGREPLSGEQILAVIKDEVMATTAKAPPLSRTVIHSYFPEGQSIRLISRSKKEFLIKQEDLTILGVLVGLMRFF